jgi:HAD superfamily phosphatase (TIGR01668 family)
MLFPRAVLPSLLHLTPEWLASRGLKGVILDLDNTLLPYGEEALPPEHEAWLKGLREAVPIYLLSNAMPERFARLQKKLNLPGHAPALKPWLGFRRALRALGLPPMRWPWWGTRSSPTSWGQPGGGLHGPGAPSEGAGVLLHAFHTDAGNSV